MPKIAFVDAWPSWMYETPYVRPPRNCMSSEPPSTFGLRSRNDCMSRLLRGRSCSCCSFSPWATAGLSRTMSLFASAETVTDSLSEPSSSFASTRAMDEARRTTFVCSNFLKLVVTISTRYEPGRRFVASKRPSASVPTVRGTPVASSVISTEAPATTPPWGSVTVPRIVPRNDCAEAMATASTVSSTKKTTRVATHGVPHPGVSRSVRMFVLLGGPSR